MGGPKAQKLPPPIEAPTVDEAQVATQDADRLRKRKGRSANILTGAGGDTALTTGNTKLLGGA